MEDVTQYLNKVICVDRAWLRWNCSLIQPPKKSNVKCVPLFAYTGKKKGDVTVVSGH